MKLKNLNPEKVVIDQEHSKNQNLDPEHNRKLKEKRKKLN